MNAVVFFRVVDPESAVVKVLDHIRATSQISQTTLRNVVGQSELDELLTKRDKLNQMLQKIIDEHTDPWGVKVATVEIKEVELAEQMKRMMSAQAEAERERRAKIIHADGELQASKKLTQAGAVMAKEPTALQLRYLATLSEIASERNSTIVFPLPIEMFKAFSGLSQERMLGSKKSTK
ncbi:hypothetical protein ES707_18567 [subsurface metagenome]